MAKRLSKRRQFWIISINKNFKSSNLIYWKPYLVQNLVFICIYIVKLVIMDEHKWRSCCTQDNCFGMGSLMHMHGACVIFPPKSWARKSSHLLIKRLFVACSPKEIPWQWYIYIYIIFNLASWGLISTKGRVNMSLYVYVMNMYNIAFLAPTKNHFLT